MTELEKLKMDDKYISQNDIVKRYLHNKLTPEETVEFEEYILDKPELLERLELDSVFYSDMPKIRTNKINKNWQTWWRPLYSHAIATVASFALVTMLLTNSIMALYEHKDSPNIVYLETYRSGQASFVVTFAKSEEAKIVVLMAPVNNEGPFTISATKQLDGYRIDLKEHFNANETGELVFVLPKNRLKPSTYQIVLIDQSNTIFNSFDVEVKYID